jgi:hypothetical protein
MLLLLCVACRIKERLQQKLAESGSAVVSKPMDWAALGVPEWLADRAERLGFLFPTGMTRLHHIWLSWLRVWQQHCAGFTCLRKHACMRSKQGATLELASFTGA